jgi:hypothetical protein
MRQAQQRAEKNPRHSVGAWGSPLCCGGVAFMQRHVENAGRLTRFPVSHIFCRLRLLLLLDVRPLGDDGCQHARGVTYPNLSFA